jgi:Na+-translocating ferredoxin:NAD+ oxidoreductase RnfD subunit
VFELEEINFKAVVIGSAVDIALSLLLSIPVGIAAGIYAAIRHLPPDSMLAVMKSGPLAVGSMVLGMSFTVLGGFISAKIAKKEPLAHAALTGMLSFVTGLCLLAVMGSENPRWMLWVGIVFTIPSAMAGGALAAKFSPAKRGRKR